jgi:toxin FitB
VLLDSNIIIYASQPEHEWLRQFIAEHSPFVSAVTYVETLGYNELSEQERVYLEEFFSASEVLPISEAVIQEAVHLRQQRRMSLGDSLVAATALTNELQLVTRNTDDFEWINQLRLLNPFEELR